MKATVLTVVSIALLLKPSYVCSFEITRDEFNTLVGRMESLERENSDLVGRTDALEKENKVFAGKTDALEKENRVLIGKTDALEKENSELKRTIVDLAERRSRVDRFVMDSMEGPIAFTAGVKPLFVNDMDPHETIVFETTVTDIGGGYNNSTGVFVAPRSGVYVFACSLLDHYENGLMLHAEIVKDHTTVLGRIFAHAEQDKYRDQGANTVVTHLNAGEQVWVRIWDSNNLSLGGELYSTFTGYLLYGGTL